MSSGSDSALLRTMTGSSWHLRLAAVVIFIAATGVAFVAQNSDMPRTAAVVYLLGVMLVGAMVGLWGGLLAAVVASLVYNFFLSDPVFRFSLTSAEEFVPLVAFNLSAAASGLLAGRLKDRALAAEHAGRRMKALLDVSQALQKAVRVEDVAAAIAPFGLANGGSPELYILADGAIAPVQESRAGFDLAQALLESGGESLQEGGRRALRLSTLEGCVGVLVVPWSDRLRRPSEQNDLEAFVNLLSITIERCLLLERLSEAEAVRRSEEFKTALLSSVSHDMRTPLSAISASASSLARFGESLAEETRADLLKMIQEQCDRLNRYTSNLLNLGRIQAGVDEAAFVDCDALEALGSAISQARGLASGHEICKAYEVAGAIVRADPMMLEQIFFNVLENSVRYSPGNLPISVSASAGNGELLVTIRDQGPGIPQEDVERVFERFYRSRGQAHQGTGLGLSISRGFAEAFGGSVDIAPPDPLVGGTAVRIRLPVVQLVDAAL